MAHNTATDDSTENVLDDKYTDGIWYDRYTGEFCQIREGDDGTIVLYDSIADPESAPSYFEMDPQKWIDEVSYQMYPVSERAIEHPLGTLREIESHGGATEHMSDTMLADYEWCVRHTERFTIDGYDPDAYL